MLEALRPVVVTPDVLQEFRRISEPSASNLLDAAISAGWAEHASAPPRDELDAVMHLEPRLSRADSGLLVVAGRAKTPLFTDDDLLARAAAKAGIAAFDLVDALMLLQKRGALDASELRAIVIDIHMKDGRIFTPSELSALDLDGLL